MVCCSSDLEDFDGGLEEDDMEDTSVPLATLRHSNFLEKLFKDAKPADIDECGEKTALLIR